METGPGELWIGEEYLKMAYEDFFQGFDKGEQDFTHHVIHGWLAAADEVRGRKTVKNCRFP